MMLELHGKVSMRRSMSTSGIHLGERLLRMTAVGGEWRAVHLFVVWVVRTGTEIYVDDASSTVRLVEEGTEDTGKVITGLQLVL